MAVARVVGLTAMIALAGCSDVKQLDTEATQKVDGHADLRQAIVVNNANMAFAVYADSLATARTMQQALIRLVEQPDEQTLASAREAWLAAREPYGQSEVYRFRNGPIDALRPDGTMGQDGEGPEGQINAWPLGEAVIDYVAPAVDGDAGPESPANAVDGSIIANVQDFPVIDQTLLTDYFEHGEDERNVTSGYHAIEFLLWGQDLNLDGGAGFERDNTPGQRPVSDYQTVDENGNVICTSGPVSSPVDICQRRGQYLLAAGALLVEDLQRIVNAWDPQGGAHYQAVIAEPEKSLAGMLESMGRLSFGELAGQRINIALTTDSQEDEHSCFSDNTHRDIYLNALGVENTYLGHYTRVDGKAINGASIHELLVAEGQQELADMLRTRLADTMSAATVIDDKAQNGEPFDVLIQQGVGQPDVTAVINALVQQTDVIEQAMSALGLSGGALRQDTEQDLGV